MAEIYTYENFLVGIKKDPDYGRELLKKEFSFHETGLVDLHTKNPEAVDIFFSNLIAEPFDVEDEVSIGKVISVGRKSDENVASVMLFIYNIFNFGGATPPSKESPLPNKTKVKSLEISNTDTTSVPHEAKIPFRDRTIQYDIMVALTTFSGTKEEFVAECEPFFEKHNKLGVNRNMVINNTISMANKRGYCIIYDKTTRKLEVSVQRS